MQYCPVYPSHSVAILAEVNVQRAGRLSCGLTESASHRLEKGPRGVYSGCLGFIGLNSTFDLNIIIRTAVVSKDEVTIGAGGAIVLQSDPEDEYEEMMLKASALVRAIDQCTGR